MKKPREDREPQEQYEFRRRRGRLGYTVIRLSDGAELGVIMPAPNIKWAVWAGDGTSYKNRVDAARALDARSAPALPGRTES